VGAADVEDDGEPFEEKMERLVDVLSEQMSESDRLSLEIREVLGGIGYEV
jgi:type I restriction enzyme M protein